MEEVNETDLKPSITMLIMRKIYTSRIYAEALADDILNLIQGKSECTCPDDKLWNIDGNIVCECGKYHKKQ